MSSFFKDTSSRGNKKEQLWTGGCIESLEFVTMWHNGMVVLACGNNDNIAL